MVVKTKKQVIDDRFAVYNGDCVEVMRGIPSGSIGFSLFSPPFVDLYKYSDDDEDLGNVGSPEQFFEHFRFVVEQLFRVMMPGRVVAVHCSDVQTFKQNGEEIGCYDFPGDLIRSFMAGGFIYHSPRVCIWKDPLIAATRTHAIGLAHKQIVKDSTQCRVGIPDCIIAFRKPGDNLKPIGNRYGLTEYYGKRHVPQELDRYVGWEGDQKENKRSHWIWQQYASPVWFDIRQTRVLQFRQARDDEDEKHVCPLQLDVIERCMALWSAKGDTFLTPFMGVGSEVYVAVKNGRKAIGVELKPSYFKQAVRNIRSLEKREEEPEEMSL